MTSTRIKWISFGFAAVQYAACGYMLMGGKLPGGIWLTIVLCSTAFVIVGIIADRVRYKELKREIEAETARMIEMYESKRVREEGTHEDCIFYANSPYLMCAEHPDAQTCEGCRSYVKKPLQDPPDSTPVA